MSELPVDNPLFVQWEFASEERLGKRNAIYRQLIDGVNAEDVLFEAVKEFDAKRVLEVGCGAGEMAERIAKELGADVVAVDTSQRMVDLTRGRGIDARLADVQALPFADGEFDCVVAGWVLYHVADRERALDEIARVLRPGGRFVTGTLADENLADLWDFLGSPRERQLSFSTVNGRGQLERVFARVEERQAEGVVVFRSPASMRDYVAANMTRAHLAAKVPDFTEPVEVRTHHTVFVADKA
jgi:SAM-dependent methyltransferase